MSDSPVSSGIGWSGRNDQVLHYLRTVGADRDGEGEDGGRFIIGGPKGVLSFMGMNDPHGDVVISFDTVYFKNGKECNLALGLGTTSYGLNVYVIC